MNSKVTFSGCSTNDMDRFFDYLKSEVNDLIGFQPPKDGTFHLCGWWGTINGCDLDNRLRALIINVLIDAFQDEDRSGVIDLMNRNGIQVVSFTGSTNEPGMKKNFTLVFKLSK